MARCIKSQSPKALLLGAGYCAKAMIASLHARGFNISVTTRSPEKAAGLKALDVTVPRPRRYYTLIYSSQ